METIERSPALEAEMAKARQIIARLYMGATIENPLNHQPVDKHSADKNDGNANAWHAHMLTMQHEMNQSDYTIESQWEEPTPAKGK